MNFARSLFTVSGLTVLSRVAGFVRDTLTAMFLGAGPIADAFFVAQRLPNLFRSLFAEGAFSSAFVPLYAAELERNGTKSAQRFAGQALALLLAVLIPFSIAIMIGMPWVMYVLAPGFENDPEKFNLAVRYSIIAFPYLALISISALQASVLNAHGRFGPGAAAPVALNLVMIAALFVAHGVGFPIGDTLAWAFALAGIVQMGWLFISCLRAGITIPLLRPRFDKTGRRLFAQIGPGAIGAGAAQVNLLISTILASTLPTGAVSYLYYADRLNQMPLGIVGIAVATTLLPLMAKHIEAGREDMALHFMNRAIEFSLLLGLPATVGLIVAPEPIIKVLFEHGRFTHADTIETARTLAAYAVGIPGFLLVKVFASCFFARQNVALPVKVALIAMVVNVVGSLVLVRLFEHAGIALANSLAIWVNAGLLFWCLRREKTPVGDERFAHRAPRLLACAVGMSFVTWSLVQQFSHLMEKPDLLHQGIGLALIIGLSTLAYGLMLQVSGAMRVQDAIAILKRKSDG
ncbi:MAG: murein biosynthesis integral membrane protein MurJ [Bdellovibrionales bacterium]